MPQTSRWPFHRIMVDHMVHGTTRVWWELNSAFNLPGSRQFTLQAGYTGLETALDWKQIGAVAADAWHLVDDTARERSGKHLLTHYRVRLEVDGAVFFSPPQPAYGLLPEADWKKAQEILRLHRLQQHAAGVDGWLLKRMRYGETDPEAIDPLTNSPIDADRLQTYGTRFKVGYHPPVAMVVEPPQNPAKKEFRGGASPEKYSASPTREVFLVSAFPMLSKEDVWVNAFTDERWIIDDISTATGLRGVPLVQQVVMKKLPRTDVVYKIPVSPESYDPGDLADHQPTTGNGCVRVDHDYGEDSALVYQTADCCPIAGARVRAFKLADWEGGARTEAYAVAESQTTTNGAWAWAMLLDPGDYVLEFFRDGQYGPDTQALTVVLQTATGSSTSVSTSSSGSSFGLY